MNDTVVFLKNNAEIFSLFSNDEITTISAYLVNSDVDSSETIFYEGDEGNELFIVKSGTVFSSVIMPNGSIRKIAQFRIGDFFGEMAMFENAPRSATCYTAEKVSLYKLHKNDFFILIKKHPETAIKLMYRILNVITERLQERSEFLSDMVIWGEKARKRAITDELTGAHNRRYFDDALEEYFKKASQSQNPLSLIMIDIDHFRVINEKFSHKSIDQIIIEIAKIFNGIKFI